MKPFEYKSPNFKKLAAYGFTHGGEAYSYTTEISDGQFRLRVDVYPSGEVKTLLIDCCTGEPYALHLVEDAGGAFVGAVRTEYESVLTDIAENCFEKDVFKGDCAHSVIEYVRQKYGDELEYFGAPSLRTPCGAERTTPNGTPFCSFCRKGSWD